MLDSVNKTRSRDINYLPAQPRRPSAFSDTIPWAEIARPLAAAEDALARLDERLAKSPIRDGWIARTHFTDACSSLWLEGTLVHMEDLVFHDAGMNLRAPTHELTQAHTVLRTRRRIAAADPAWALSAPGLESFRGRTVWGQKRAGAGSPDLHDRKDDGLACDDDTEDDNSQPSAECQDTILDEAFKALDAAMDRAQLRLTGERIRRLVEPTLERGSERTSERDPLIHDPEWDEDARLAEWRRGADRTRDFPPALASALSLLNWDAIEPLQHMPWLGRLLTASQLRDCGKTRSHLACLNLGLRAIPYERRRARDQTTRLIAVIDAFTAAAETGLKEHDRWLGARVQLERKLEGRRSTSKLPALIDYMMARPIASAAMISAELGVTSRAAQGMVNELGLREATGRDRYRAWGIL